MSVIKITANLIRQLSEEIRLAEAAKINIVIDVREVYEINKTFSCKKARITKKIKNFRIYYTFIIIIELKLQLS